MCVTKACQYDWDKTTRTFSACASDIGLGVGRWPDAIEVQNKEVPATGNFYKTSVVNLCGIFAGYIYTNASTLSLKIFNN